MIIPVKYLAFFMAVLIIVVSIITFEDTALCGEKLDRDNILFEADSIYNHITIRQTNDERCMLFGRYRDNRETCINMNEPDISIFEYTAMMFASLLLHPEPKRIALLGLGGGYIPLVFRMHLPNIRLDSVEVDPMVGDLARKYFDFKTLPNISLAIFDGRQYLKQTKILYDHIWVDTFNSDYIPAHMTTKEFLLLARSKLTERGLLVQNVHNDSRLYDSQLATFHAVFKNVFVFMGKRSGNSILIGSDNPMFFPDEMSRQLAGFNGKIGKIDLLEELNKFQPNPVRREMRILTDDYSPANLLIHQK